MNPEAKPLNIAERDVHDALAALRATRFPLENTEAYRVIEQALRNPPSTAAAERTLTQVWDVLRHQCDLTAKQLGPLLPDAVARALRDAFQKGKGA